MTESFLVPVLVAAGGLVLLVVVAVWLLMLMRRFTMIVRYSRGRFDGRTQALRAEVTGVRSAIDQRRTNGSFRFTDRGRARTITSAQE
ncbi:hypothetical protein [Sciscionella marina]|uniref:hypothetical protein n=1 Tax=Sciscionella marina TaxID=508770 RepID=UPI00036DE952|nr:hypothetical protein [Sciscionella marina]